jgi:hypothetical protein
MKQSPGQRTPIFTAFSNVQFVQPVSQVLKAVVLVHIEAVHGKENILAVNRLPELRREAASERRAV